MAAFYVSSLSVFVSEDSERVVERLTDQLTATGFGCKTTQRRAWKKQTKELKGTCKTLIGNLPDAAKWTLLLEYSIPRRQKRIDGVILARDVIFCIEFKTKAKTHNLQLRKQVEDYALDLRDFHSESHGRRIVPIATCVGLRVLRHTSLW